VTCVWAWWRAAIRKRWQVTLVLVMLTGLAFGATVAAVSGARRTDTAVSRLLEATNANDALFVGDERYFADIEHLPQVASSTPRVFLAVTPTSGSRGRSPNVATLAVLTETGTRHGAPWALVVRGRFADPTRADEVVLNETAASHLGLGIGSQMSFASFAPNQTNDFLQRNVVPQGPSLKATVVGIVRSGADLSAVEAPADVAYVGSDVVVFTKAFFEQHRNDVGHFQVVLYVRLRDGAGAFESWADSVGRLTGDRSLVGPGSDERTVATEAQRSTHVQAEALYVFAALLGLAALFIIGQAVGREIGREASESATLSALGFTTKRLRVALLGRPAVIAVAGGALGIAVAVALSRFTPIGLARRAEPRPGFDANILLLACVTSALVIVLVGRSFLAARRLANPSVSAQGNDGRGVRRRAGHRSMGSTAGAISPSASVGLGFAYDTGNRFARRTTVIGLIVSLGAIVASAVFAASLLRFSATPAQQGWTWDLAVGNPHTQVDTRDEAVPFLTAAPVVAGFVGITGEPSFGAAVNGKFSTIVGFDESSGSIGPPILTGRAPSTAEEIAIGVRTMEAAHARIGDEVTVESDAGTANYRVVGTAVVSPLITNGQIRLGEGMMVTLEGLGRVSSSPLVNQYLISLRRTVPLPEALAALRSQFPSAVVPFYRAADVENLWHVRNLPYLLALLLVILALGTLAHSLVASVRDHRRDLATLAALGFTPRQLSRVVRWQAASLVVPSVAVAIPLGIVAGRLAWQGLADQLGVSTPTVVPALALIIGAVALALLVNAVAVLPSRRAASGDPVSALRSDGRG
jgi:ABC-type lipoprotein release transport system permease subunit